MEILPGSYGELERIVASGAADLAFVRFPPDEPGFVQRPLLRSGSVCVMPLGHPLAALDVVHAADLVPHALVLLGRERPVRQAMDALFRRQGAVVTGRVEVHSVASACALVAEGLGVTVANRFMALLFGGPGVEIRPFKPEMHSDYGVISAAGAPLTSIAEHFVSELASTLNRQMGLADGKR